jgi:DNA polymerase-3 subunit alpha
MKAYVENNPMDKYRELWQRVVKVNLSKPDEIIEGNYTLIGIIKNIKVIKTAKGKNVVFGILEDYNGEIEIVFFHKKWFWYKNRIEEGKTFILTGKLEKTNLKRKVHFIVSKLRRPRTLVFFSMCLNIFKKMKKILVLE